MCVWSTASFVFVFVFVWVSARVREVHRMVCVCSVHQTCRSRTPKGLTATTQTLALPLYSSTFYNTFATTCVSSQYQGSPSLSGLRAPAAHFFTSQLGALELDPPFKPLKPPTPFKLCLLHTHGKIERLKWVSQCCWFSPQKSKRSEHELASWFGDSIDCTHPSLLDAFSDDTGKIV